MDKISLKLALDAIGDDASEELYGITSSDGELPPLEKWLRENARLQAEIEAEAEVTIWSMTADPADILEMKQEGIDWD